ncbi:MAG: glycosyltransferase family 4 protein [Bdellovibrionales bacterium]|nr:glycosyltransferase family 4 protein [Bdellovibrionales bacterium]
MKILSMYYTDKPGGFCKRLYSLLNALVTSGHEVHYLTLDKPPISLSNKIKVHIIPFPFPDRTGLKFWILFLTWAPIFAAFKSVIIQPKRFVVFGSFYAAIISLAKYLVGQKSVLFVRSIVFDVEKENNLHWLLRWANGLVYKFGFRNADKVVFQTATMKAKLETIVKTSFIHSELLPNNVVELPDSQQQIDLNISSDTLVLLAAGMLNKAKNLEFVIKNLADLKEKIFLLIVGDGPEIPKLKSLCKKLSFTQVYFTGWLPNLKPAFNKADILIHPSLREGMSNTILEALGSELPVLASNIPEHQEILLYPELLFSISDKGKELKAKLIELSQKGELYKSLKYLCKERAIEYKFNWESRAVEIAIS